MSRWIRGGQCRASCYAEDAVPVFSMSSYDGLVAHLLEQRGLRTSATGMRIHPENAVHGKEGVNHRQHLLPVPSRGRSPGLPAAAFDLDRIGDRAFRLELMCAASPLAAREAAVLPRGVGRVFIIAEIVERVTARHPHGRRGDPGTHSAFAGADSA